MAGTQRLAFAADEFHQLYDRWPSHAELLELDPSLPRSDFWGRDFVFERTAAGEYVVRSKGRDGKAGNADDAVSWPMNGLAR